MWKAGEATKTNMSSFWDMTTWLLLRNNPSKAQKGEMNNKSKISSGLPVVFVDNMLLSSGLEKKLIPSLTVMHLKK